MKSKNIEQPVSNLYIKSWGLDSNGNRKIVVGFPNDKGFAIQTNGTLPKTQNILRSTNGEFSEEELITIGKEITNYVKEFGSNNVKSRLKVYSSYRTESVNKDRLEKLIESKVRKMLGEGFFNVNDTLLCITYSDIINALEANYEPSEITDQTIMNQFNDILRTVVTDAKFDLKKNINNIKQNL